MTALTEKEIYEFLDNNRTLAEIKSDEIFVKSIECNLPEWKKDNKLGHLHWERVERLEYIKALKSYSDFYKS